MPYTPDLVAKEADLKRAQTNGSSTFSQLNWLPYAIIAILLCVLYYRVAVKLVYDWYTLPDYSHGPLYRSSRPSLSGIKGRRSAPLPSSRPGQESPWSYFQSWY